MDRSAFRAIGKIVESLALVGVIGFLAFALAACGEDEQGGAPLLPPESYEVIPLPEPPGSPSFTALSGAVTVDSQDRLWGVFKITTKTDIERWLVVAGPEGVAAHTLRSVEPNFENSLVVDRDGVAWLADANTGVWNVVDGQETLRSETPAVTVALAPDGTVWSVTGAGELTHFDGNIMSSYSPPPSVTPYFERIRPDHPLPLVVTADGLAWIGLWMGPELATFDENKGEWSTIRNTVLSGHARNLAIAPDGTLLMASSQRLELTQDALQGCQGPVHQHERSDSPPPYGTPEWWTCDAGISQFDGTDWRLINSDLDGFVNSVAADSGGGVATTQAGGLVHLINGTARRSFKVPWNDSILYNEIAFTSDGRLVLGSPDGFVVVDLQRLPPNETDTTART